MEDFYPSAAVIADSVSPWGVRLTTMVVTMHRFMLPELNTHRWFSRNSGSSRAIPVIKSLTRVMDAPALPLVWRSERTGMVGGDPLPDDVAAEARKIWLAARNGSAAAAADLIALGVHKSTINRLLEPFLDHTVVISATDWDGFWQQRISFLAQDEIRVAAEAMHAAYTASTPQPVKAGDWHLPFITPEELAEHGAYKCRRISSARCARTSYLTHRGIRDITADLNLFQRLVEADPPHASPLEHVATPLNPRTRRRQGNFRGWRQLRHMLLADA